MTDLNLETRPGLPEALRVLLAEFPRETWSDHRGFDGLIRFWLDRHLMFRRLVDLMKYDTQSLLDGGIDPSRFNGRLARLGNDFVGQLRAHHQIEDMHYFPALEKRDQRLARGFSLLDKDHHALDVHLQGFTGSANAVLGADPGQDRSGAAGSFHAQLGGLNRLLDRHLVDEEELVVPVILKYGSEDLP